MANKNKHMIRHKAKGSGKKWRPSPNDPGMEGPKSKPPTKWYGTTRDLFSKGG